MSRFAVGYSDYNNSKTAFSLVCEQLCTGMGRREPILIVFSSDIDNFEFYSKQLRRRFPFSTILGMTAYMGFSSKGYSKHALSCLAIMEGIEIKAGKVKDPEGGFGEFTTRVIDSMGKLPDKSNTLCFTCGAKMFEYHELCRMQDMMKANGIKLCGGSLGEEKDKNVLLSYNGDVFERGGVYCFIHNLCGRIELLTQSMNEDGLENIWNKTADTVKDWGIKPEFSIVANGIDYTLMMEQQNMLYRFTDKFCMEFGEYIGFSGYKDENFYETCYDSMSIAVFE